MIRLNRGDFVLCAGVLTGAFLLLELVIGGVMLVRKPDEGILVSQGLLSLTACFLILGVTGRNLFVGFNCGLKYSQTRRAVLQGTLGLSALEGLLCAGLAGALEWTERHLCTILWQVLAGKAAVVVHSTPEIVFPEGLDPARVLLVEDFRFLPWWGPALIVLGGLVAGICTGATAQRFGTRARWMPVALCWMPTICLNLFPRLENFLLQVGLAAAAGVLALVVWSFWSLLHAVIQV